MGNFPQFYIFKCIRLFKFHVSNVFSLYRDNSVDKLIKALEDLWETFLNSISSSVSDYLSVEHLGLILNRLAEQGNICIQSNLP